MGRVRFHLKLWHVFILLVIIGGAIVRSHKKRELLIKKIASGEKPQVIQNPSGPLNLVYTTTKFISVEKGNGYTRERYSAPDTLGNCIRYYMTELTRDGWTVTRNEYNRESGGQEIYFLKGSSEIEVKLDASNPPGTEIVITKK